MDIQFLFHADDPAEDSGSNGKGASLGRRELAAKHGKVWNEVELRQDFKVRGTMAPFVTVVRKADGREGSLEFQDMPRYYFHFVADDETAEDAKLGELAASDNAGGNEVTDVPLRLTSVHPDYRGHDYFPFPLAREDGSFYTPLLEVAVTGPGACGRVFPVGHRGRLSVGQLGTSSYDFHREVPVDGWGIPRAAVVVVERDPDGSMIRTPYLDWCRRVGLEVRCNRCDADLLRENPGPCTRGR